MPEPTERRETDVVFNVVITPRTFRYLEWFVHSLIAESAVNVRLVANGCAADDVHRMQAFAATAPARVSIFELAAAAMAPHGVALDEIYRACDDGALFGFVDSDVKAKQPFMPAFLDLLPHYNAITAGNVAWSDDTVLPPDARDLVGRHAVGSDGYVYGASYLALYERAAVDRVREKWVVSFRAGAHDQLPAPVQARLTEMGRAFRSYDTAKVLNILLQGDGYALTHVENPALVHIGGISQYLSDPGNPLPVSSGAGRDRAEFAHWAAATLIALVDGGELPARFPEGIEAARARIVRDELVDLARRYG